MQQTSIKNPVCLLCPHPSQLEASNPAAAQLLALSQLINQAVGDALSCLLAVELTLGWVGWLWWLWVG